MTFDVLEAEYMWAWKTPSDFYLHMPMLRALASVCDHVTEMGVRDGISSRAFLVENCKLVSYDIVIQPHARELFEKARSLGRDVQLIQANTLVLDIEETDLLFIDTDHCYYQLSQELRMHGNKARKYLAFHDTGNPYGGELLPAIMEFLAANPRWIVHSHTTECHGFTVLKRVA